MTEVMSVGSPCPAVGPVQGKGGSKGQATVSKINTKDTHIKRALIAMYSVNMDLPENLALIQTSITKPLTTNRRLCHLLLLIEPVPSSQYTFMGTILGVVLLERRKATQAYAHIPLPMSLWHSQFFTLCSQCPHP